MNSIMNFGKKSGRQFHVTWWYADVLSPLYGMYVGVYVK